MIIPFSSCKFRFCLFSEYLLVTVLHPCFLHIFRFLKKIIKSAVQCSTQCTTLPSTRVKLKHLLEMKLFQNKEHEYVSM